MEKHFVTYPQALALKEIGFDEPCMGKYDTKQGDEWLLNIYSGHLNTQFSDKNKACIAPLKSQVFEWFRKYKLSVVIHDLRDDYEANIIEWTLDDDKISYGFLQLFETYEEAESACIDKLIELVKGQ
jgi:hypothetical protein